MKKNTALQVIIFLSILLCGAIIGAIFYQKNPFFVSIPWWVGGFAFFIAASLAVFWNSLSRKSLSDNNPLSKYRDEKQKWGYQND